LKEGSSQAGGSDLYYISCLLLVRGGCFLLLVFRRNR